MDQSLTLKNISKSVTSITSIVFNDLFRVEHVDLIYDVIVYPYLPSFHSFNNIIFRILIVLFTFVGDKSDQASTAKRSKRGSKEEKHASHDVGNRAWPTAIGLWLDSLTRGCRRNGGRLSAVPCSHVFATPICFLFNASF